MLFGLAYPSKLLISDKKLEEAAEKSLISNSSTHQGRDYSHLKSETLKNTSLGTIGRIFASLFMTGRIERAITKASGSLKNKQITKGPVSTTSTDAITKLLTPTLKEPLRAALKNPEGFFTSSESSKKEKLEVSNFLSQVDLSENHSKVKFLQFINQDNSSDNLSIKDLEDKMKILKEQNNVFIEKQKSIKSAKGVVVDTEDERKKQNDDFKKLEQDIKDLITPDQGIPPEQTSPSEFDELAKDVEDLRTSQSKSSNTQKTASKPLSIESINRDLAKLAVTDEQFFTNDAFADQSPEMYNHRKKTEIAQQLADLSHDDIEKLAQHLNQGIEKNQLATPVKAKEIVKAQTQAKIYLEGKGPNKAEELKLLEEILSKPESFFQSTQYDDKTKRKYLNMLLDADQSQRTVDNQHLYQALSAQRAEDPNKVILAQGQGNLYFRGRELDALQNCFSNPHAFFDSNAFDNQTKTKIANVLVDTTTRNRNEENFHLYKASQEKQAELGKNKSKDNASERANLIISKGCARKYLGLSKKSS